MNSRRKFLIQGSMATTALLVAKPFQTIAETGIPLGGLTANNNKIAFLHTSNPAKLSAAQLVKEINTCKNNSHVVLMDAADATEYTYATLPYDASINRNNSVSGTSNNFRVIYKGNIKIGVISATAADTDVVSHVNKFSAYLKNEKKCHIVVCLSQLGYKNKNTPDDITLVKKSIHLDLIIGGNTKNFHQHPVILLNSNNEEVIIHSAAGDSAAFGKIDIDFNEKGQKKNISFTNNL